MKNKKKIALFLENSRNAGRSMLRGVIRYSNMSNNWILNNFFQTVFYARKVTPNRGSVLKRLNDWGVDGVITREPDIVEELIAKSVPTVIVITSNDNFPQIPRTVMAPDKIAQMAFEHFQERGFQNYAYCGYNNLIWSEQRCQEFAKQVQQANHNLFIYEQPKSQKNKLWENELKTMVKWLKSLPKPTAIFCCNDDRGVQVIEACKETGLMVPEEIAVLGVDNDDLICTVSHPQLSSITLDFTSLGWQVALMMDKLIKGQKMKGQKLISYPINIKTRHSTDILALSDPILSTALRYANNNATKFFNVDDIAAACAISRRTLERRFKKVLGYTVHSQIRRIHISQISQMLLTTNLNISEIAFKMGFNDAKNLSRYFKQEMGLSPKQYRNQYTPFSF